MLAQCMETGLQRSNLQFCVNVAVNIGSAFQVPESLPSFVHVDSRVEVVIKHGCYHLFVVAILRKPRKQAVSMH